MHNAYVPGTRTLVASLSSNEAARTMIRRRVYSVDATMLHPSSRPRPYYAQLPRRGLADGAKSSGGDPIQPKKEWSALRISGIVLLVGTVISHFLLLYLARKLRKRTPLASKGSTKILSSSERKSSDVDKFYSSTISIPNNVSKHRKEQCLSSYVGITVDSSSSLSPSCSTHSNDQEKSSSGAARGRLRSYRKFSSESASTSTDSRGTPQLQDQSYKLDGGLNWSLASISWSGQPVKIEKAMTSQSFQNSTKGNTPSTAKVMESCSSSATTSTSSHRIKLSRQIIVASDQYMMDDMLSSSSVMEIQEEWYSVQYPNVNSNSSVVALSSICMGDRLQEETQSVFCEGRRPVDDIPCTIFTTKKHRQHRLRTRCESPKQQEHNALQVLFGKL
jgi:hypothetical protein